MRAALRRIVPLEAAIVAVACAILIALAVIGERTKPQPSPLDSYSTFDAGSGGYRAYYELLARVRISTDRFTLRPAFLDRDVDTLVWTEPLVFDPRQQVPTRADVAALESWVRAGGQLLYIGHDDAAARAGLLHLPRSRPARASRSLALLDPSLARLRIARVFSESTRRWRVPPNGRVLLDDGRGPLVVRYAFGAGRVTAAIDETLFTNANLARGDRARLAVALGTPRSAGGRMAFDETVHGFGTPEHWWQVIPRDLALALALAAVALVVATIGAAARLGPPVRFEPRTDRGTADFIDAVASLFARAKAVRRALTDAEASTTHALARAFGLADESPTAIAERIERRDRREAYCELVRIARHGYPGERNLVRGVALRARLAKGIRRPWSSALLNSGGACRRASTASSSATNAHRTRFCSHFSVTVTFYSKAFQERRRRCS